MKDHVNALTFSQAFGISKTGKEDWFDQCIVVDSALCVDPFLMLDMEHDDEFKGAHDEIVAFFRHQLHAVAQAGPDFGNPISKNIIADLTLREVDELTLGFSKSNKGTGSGHKLATAMAAAMVSAIGHGLTEINHFEEIGLLSGNMGPDRISDAAAGITKWRFAKYTTRICKELGVPTELVTLDRARYSLDDQRWVAIQAELPHDPATGRPLMLSPKRFLRKLPVLGIDEFSRFAARQWTEQNRDKLEQKLVRFDKDRILDEARKDPVRRKEFIEFAKRTRGTSYNFVNDPLGLTAPDAARAFVANHPLAFEEPESHEDMGDFVRKLCGYFKHYLEEQRGWSVLWDGNKGKPEKAVQTLFLGVVYLTCASNNVAVDPEANIGRGPVDFKFSKGFKAKCLLEVKLARNRKLKEGLSRQLTAYLNADHTRIGIFLIVKYDDNHDDMIYQVQLEAQQMQLNGHRIEVVVIDACKDKPSASKL